jgi:hypothetical protein
MNELNPRPLVAVLISLCFSHLTLFCDPIWFLCSILIIGSSQLVSRAFDSLPRAPKFGSDRKIPPQQVRIRFRVNRRKILSGVGLIPTSRDGAAQATDADGPNYVRVGEDG